MSQSTLLQNKPMLKSKMRSGQTSNYQKKVSRKTRVKTISEVSVDRRSMLLPCLACMCAAAATNCAIAQINGAIKGFDGHDVVLLYENIFQI